MAIVGGGYTKIEAAIVNTPFIPISLHKHQEVLIKNFNRKLSLPTASIIESNRINFFLQKKISFFKDYKNRKKFVKKLKKFNPDGITKLTKILNWKKKYFALF